VDAGVIPGLIAIDEHAGSPRLIADLKGRIRRIDHHRTPGVETNRSLRGIAQLAFDDDATFMTREASGGNGRAGLPLQR
jgi:hypothetical protein